VARSEMSPDMAALPEPYTAREVAAMFKVSPVTVWRWAEAGHLEYFKTPGGHRRFPVKATRELLLESTELRKR
jgi:excisionase family DNA binding protein